jgi:hypothetical protein
MPSFRALILCAVLVGVSLPAATPARAESLRSGSGFAVAPGVVVTNAHVVEGCRALRVLHGAQARGGRVLAIDREQDLAAVQSDLAVPAVLALRASPALRVGESVVAFGFPLAGSLSREGNLTTGNVSALAGLRDDARYLQITAPVQPGNSGGPLLDDSANVIGVITAKLDAVAIAKRTGDIPQNVNFAVNGQSLERFLQDARIGYQKQVADRRLAVADIGDVARAAAVRVECSASGVQASTQTPVPPQAVEPLPPPPPAVEPAIEGPAPALADVERSALVARMRVHAVRTPYPRTSPDLRALTIVNESSASVYRVTVGWLDTPAANCPATASAYRGRKEVHVALAPGATVTTMSSFPASARLFCIVDAAFTPVPSKRAQPGEMPGAGSGQPNAEEAAPSPPPPHEDNL